MEIEELERENLLTPDEDDDQLYRNKTDKD
jgi:hypothetical protein